MIHGASMESSSPRAQARLGGSWNGADHGTERNGTTTTTPSLPSTEPRLGTNGARQPESVATVSLAEYEALHRQLEDMAGELSAARTALTREHNANNRLRKKLEEIAELDKDDEETKELPEREKTILTFLGWWRDYTGRPKTTRIDLTTARATLVRRELSRRPVESRRTPQELCWMVIGICRDEWYVQHEKTDIKHMLKDEAIAERFLKLGRPKDEA